MDDRRFDALTRTLAQHRTRRQVLTGLAGAGIASLAAVVRSGEDAQAARRGFSGPKFPLPTPVPCTDSCSDACPCAPNHVCIGGMCFAPCIGCACGACTLVPGHGSVCANEAYATSGSCQGICDAGYACDGASLCIKPCPI
jgi:hypothetical protein